MGVGERLDGRGVLVTGGGSGLGRGVCERIAAEGALVAIADIRPHLAEETARRITDAGGTAIAVECDVGDETAVAGAVRAAVDAFGGLWGLVANAGTAGRGWVHETALGDWEAVLRVNLTGAFLSAKHVLPHLLDGGGGSIVVTSSIAGSVIGGAGSAASYAVSKAGVIQLARQIAVDYGDRGIRANAIQPGGVEGSNLGRHAAEDAIGHGTSSEPLPRPKPWLPIRRAGRLEEYGATVAFLLSDDAGYITGASIPVDGGYLAT